MATYKNRPVQLIVDVVSVNPNYDYTREASADNPYEMPRKAGEILDHPDSHYLVAMGKARWYDVPAAEPVKLETTGEVIAPGIEKTNQVNLVPTPQVVPASQPEVPVYAYGGIDAGVLPETSATAVVAVPSAAEPVPAPAEPAATQATAADLIT